MLAAAELASRLLASTPDRLRYTQGVATQAEFVSTCLGPDQAALLVAAAWLHEIGYAAEVQDTGFHPIDGARYLEGRRWPAEIANLVAHHSGSRFLAAALGLESLIGRYSSAVDPLSTR